ncbi:hypothetical protein EYF80_019654 [Liparis tanakae]|uniref:Uncharacterized protein n=1 Tax=Liparis tanakae TaxID=230148 RepID=A0A4Z2HYU1_9TELE|nr:hypothetical protein EYF80_019654 [Liparis tanakae]
MNLFEEGQDAEAQMGFQESVHWSEKVFHTCRKSGEEKNHAPPRMNSCAARREFRATVNGKVTINSQL